jgi:hypothetical protein
MHRSGLYQVSISGTCSRRQPAAAKKMKKVVANLVACIQERFINQRIQHALKIYLFKRFICGLQSREFEVHMINEPRNTRYFTSLVMCFRKVVRTVILNQIGNLYDKMINPTSKKKDDKP